MRGAYDLLMLLFPAAVNAFAGTSPHQTQNQEPNLRGYSLKERSTVETMILTLDQLIELGPLSFSEDTMPIELANFNLVLYETKNGVLPVSPSVETLQSALQAFLLAELNAYFNQNHQVDTVQAAIVQQRATATRKGGKTIEGTQIESAVDVLFAYTPTPKYEEIEDAMQTILMGDLSNLVSNMTKLAKNDEFLQDVHTIEYSGRIPILNPEKEDDDNTNTTFTGIVTTQEQTKGLFSSVRFFVPILLASALILILIILFVVPRRRKQEIEPQDSSKLVAPLSEIASHDGTGLNLYYDENSPLNEQNDAYSIEADMVEDIPLTPPSYRKADDQSDIFSGIGAASSNISRKSPRNTDSRSVFSFLSNLGSKSTVVASNVTTTQEKTSPANSSVARKHAVSSRSGSGTPRSRMSSLFTFSEEESDENTHEIKADTKLVIQATPSDEETAPFDEVEISAMQATPTKTGSTTESPKRHASPLAAMAASALSFVKSRPSGTPKKSTSTPTHEDRLKGFTSSPLATMAAGALSFVQGRESPSKYAKTNEPTTPAPEDEMTSFTTDDIAKDIQKAEEEFIKTKQTTDSPATSKMESKNPSENPVPPRKNISSTCDHECGPGPCGPGLNIAASSDLPLEQDAVSAGALSRSISPQRHAQAFSPQSSIDGSLEIDSTSPASSGAEIGKLTIDTGNGKVKTNKAINDPSPADKSPIVASSSPQSDKSSRTNPDQTGGSASSENKKFMKLFFKSPKRAAANKAFALTADDSEIMVEAQSERVRNNRRSMGSPGLADGTSDYQNMTSEHHSPVSSSNNSLSFIRGNGKLMTKGERMKFEGSLQETDEEWISPSGRVRKHTKSTAADGTNNYQNQYMRQYSTEGLDMEESTLDDSYNGASRKRRMQIRTDLENEGSTGQAEALTPKSNGTNYSSVSGFSGNSPMTKSPESSGKQLINDLIWLEEKIAAPIATQRNSPTMENNIEQSDSLSFASGDGKVSTAGDSKSDRNYTTLNSSEPSEIIVCRDCIAPPGKLKIVIHSTKDGPAVHTVKKGSVLTGHMFPGDLIISVDNVDTRSYSAEQVMKLMTAKNKHQRKITVLHIENATN